MLKKLLPLFAAALCLLTACGGEKEKTFTVGFDANFPPYGFKDTNGEYTGFDLE
ncbi:MAG: transporter substrate-binding domain-containing protein, partial [Lentisphaeria bacterium]|nr:transporter substrate-binding domain-containing protein [Lentisphaeria bacterium]